MSKDHLREHFGPMLDDAWVSCARQHPSMLPYGMEVSRLPPRLWEQLRLQLQEEYRRATGEKHAILVVETGDPT